MLWLLPLTVKAEESKSDREEWFVAHVKPRCEKKLVEYGEVYGFKSTLPTYKSVKNIQVKRLFFINLFSQVMFFY